MVECRECGVRLVEGENWHASRAKKGDYICIECKKAYDRQWREENPDYTHPLIICKECGKEKPHVAHGLCVACYERPIITCKECGKRKPHQAHGLCEACYERQRDYKRPTITCKECGEEGPHAAHGLCTTCYHRQWCRENPDKAREIKHHRRARKANAATGEVDEQAVFERYDNTCIYCGSKKDLTLDHVVSLNGSGAHCEDNLVVACRSCNSSKRDKPLEEWLQTQPRARAWVM